MRAEYDFSKQGPVTIGKYFYRATAGKTVVVLDDDVAKVFPYPDAVNRALRLLIEIGVEKSPDPDEAAKGTRLRQAAAVGRKPDLGVRQRSSASGKRSQPLGSRLKKPARGKTKG